MSTYDLCGFCTTPVSALWAGRLVAKDIISDLGLTDNIVIHRVETVKYSELNQITTDMR